MLWYKGRYHGSIVGFSLSPYGHYLLVLTSDGDSWPTPSNELGTEDCYFTVVCPD